MNSTTQQGSHLYTHTVGANAPVPGMSPVHIPTAPIYHHINPPIYRKRRFRLKHCLFGSIGLITAIAIVALVLSLRGDLSLASERLSKGIRNTHVDSFSKTDIFDACEAYCKRIVSDLDVNVQVYYEPSEPLRVHVKSTGFLSFSTWVSPRYYVLSLSNTAFTSTIQTELQATYPTGEIVVTSKEPVSSKSQKESAVKEYVQTSVNSLSFQAIIAHGDGYPKNDVEQFLQHNLPAVHVEVKLVNQNDRYLITLEYQGAKESHEVAVSLEYRMQTVVDDILKVLSDNHAPQFKIYVDSYTVEAMEQKVEAHFSALLDDSSHSDASKISVSAHHIEDHSVFEVTLTYDYATARGLFSFEFSYLNEIAVSEAMEALNAILNDHINLVVETNSDSEVNEALRLIISQGLTQRSKGVDTIAVATLSSGTSYRISLTKGSASDSTDLVVSLNIVLRSELTTSLNEVYSAVQSADFNCLFKTHSLYVVR
ncbi:hypothetical protein GEMRC1_004695 [Eukaryota sp. GEM-RC1]